MHDRSPDSRPCVLIFDDHAPSRLVACLALSSLGYVCAGVSTESDALLAIDRLAPDVIIYECHRPDGAFRRGFSRDLRDRAEAIGSTVIVVAMSFLDAPSSTLRSEECIDRYLTKPFELRVLGEALARQR